MILFSIFYVFKFYLFYFKNLSIVDVDHFKPVSSLILPKTPCGSTTTLPILQAKETEAERSKDSLAQGPTAQKQAPNVEPAESLFLTIMPSFS